MNQYEGIISFCVFHSGCDSLEYDAECLREQLTQTYGLRAASVFDADIIVYLGCSFSAQKEAEFKASIDALLKESKGKLLIISGCYLDEYQKHSKICFARRDGVAQVVNQYLKNQRYLSPYTTKCGQKRGPVVAISEGCFGECTFCSVRLVRGNHVSRPAEDILSDIEQAYQVNEVIKLAGQDVAAYGRDKGGNLAQLLSRIFNRFPSIRCELGPMNPEWLNRMDDAELRILGHEQVVGNLHVPLQSASDKVLRRMKRHYTYDDYLVLWNRLSRLGINTLSTDLMAGYPGETAEDHMRTLGFIESHPLEFAQIFMYEPRPRTKAVIYTPLPVSVRLTRTMELIATYVEAYMRFHGLDAQQVALGTESTPPYNTNVILTKEYLTHETQ